MPRSATSGSITWVKPPLTTASSYPSRFSVRTSVRAPGVSSDAVAHGLEVRFLQAGEEAHPAAQRVGEVDLSRHGGLGDRRHLAAAPAAFGQQVDHLALQQGGVGVQDDQVLGPAVQAGRLDREVDLRSARPPRPAPAASWSRSAPATDELVAVHRVGRQADDPLDVAAAARDRAPSRPRAWPRRSRAPEASPDGSVGRPRPSLPRRGARRSPPRPPPAKRCASASRTGSTVGGAPCPPPRRAAAGRAPGPAPRRPPRRRAAASAANRRSAMPGPSCPLTVTRIRRRRRRRHGRATSFSVDPPEPSTQRCTMRAGTPATTQRSGISPRTTAPAATTTCSPICAPGQDHRVGPEPAARADADRRLGRPLAPDGLDRVLVGVVLVRDVDVGPGLDVVADHDLPVAHDVRAPADEAAAADATRPGRSASPGPAPSRPRWRCRGRRSSRHPTWIRCSL